MFRRTVMTGLMAGAMCIPATCLTNPAFAQTALPELSVEADALWQDMLYKAFSPRASHSPAMADGGSFLTSIPGVSASRMGGHGLDPVIRGQQQTQLNILADGAFVHGGCPNRMDPPASFASPETYDSVVVERGYQSVTNGPGGTGGTVRFERTPQNFTANTAGLAGSVGASYNSNGRIRSTFADIAAGNALAQMRGIVSATRAGNYDDGHGNRVRSAYDHTSASLMPVWNVSADTTVSLGLDAAYTRDTLFEGASMDAPYDRSSIWRAKIDRKLDYGSLKTFLASAYYSDVEHEMDNYTLRDNTGMKMKTPSTSDTFGGKAQLGLELANLPVTIGFDHQTNQRMAHRYSGTAMQAVAATAQSLLWPDVSIRQSGLFAETDIPASQKLNVRVGARYDHVDAAAKAANTVFGAMSANSLYNLYYGYGASPAEENNFGGLVRAEYDVSAGLMAYAGFSRSVRTADATERYMAGNASMASGRWVGNPDIEPEKHHQLDIGLAMEHDTWGLELGGYYNKVSDFIMRDTARGQDGILLSNGATIYRNIDATLKGFDIGGHYAPMANIDIGGNLTWTYGQNNEDHDALAQIPPLEGRVTITYSPERWTFGSTLNFASKQTRIDDDTSDRDARETPGYGTLDLFGGYSVGEGDIRFGVNNLLDKNYARHLNRSNAFDLTEAQVNEPGRSVYLSFHAPF